ncbi:hypothetical protein Ahia01_001285300 [Argonauta hians]
MLRMGSDHTIDWLTHIINKVWIPECSPEDRTRGVILPFWKHKGDRQVCSYFRGITLLSIPGKIFSRILLMRAIPYFRGENRRPQQAGFMPNRSTTNQISALRLIVEKAHEFRCDRRLYIAFLDLRAAFDSVDPSSLWKILTIIGVPRKIITLFQRMYAKAEGCVCINTKDSRWFPINSGVQQGCVATPDLFNCIIDYLMDRVCSQGLGIRLGSYTHTDLEYTDDTALFCSSRIQLEGTLGHYQKEANKLGLKDNWRKTKLMLVGDEVPLPLHVDGEEVEFVSSFNYLGSTITNNGNLGPEINRRRTLAANVMRALWKPLWRHRSISRNTKLRIYRTTVLLYRAKT